MAISICEGRLQRRARVLLARCYLKYPEKTKEAEKQLRIVIERDPEQADAHYYLGRLYRSSGLTARARASFRKTLELKPRHREAAAELETLGEEPESGDRVLKKLFGRE